jgi:hypothetical protein
MMADAEAAFPNVMATFRRELPDQLGGEWTVDALPHSDPEAGAIHLSRTWHDRYFGTTVVVFPATYGADTNPAWVRHVVTSTIAALAYSMARAN